MRAQADCQDGGCSKNARDALRASAYCTQQIANGQAGLNGDTFFDICFSGVQLASTETGFSSIWDELEQSLTTTGNCLKACNDNTECANDCLEDFADSSEETVAPVASLFDYHYTSDPSYYHSNNINARHVKCLNSCNNDANCEFYCTDKAADETAKAIDIQLGNIPTAEATFDQCDVTCQAWDWNCMKTCQGSSWVSALSLAQQPKEPVSLAKVQKWNKYDTASDQYYTQDSIKARNKYCLSRCNGDFDCKFFCNDLRW